MPLLKKLTPIGNSLGLILDRPVLDMVGIDVDTVVELTTEKGAIIVRPVQAHRDRVRASTRKVIKAHRGTLKKLADG
jgi:antitoxin component of MazEF toxin-antitoxin module